MDFRGKLILAPLAGVADSVFRRICRRLGADVTWSEMVSADGLTRNWARNQELISFEESERPYGIQLFGHDPQTMGRAAGMVSELEPDFIDLNFGCPVPKVVKRGGGAALMRDPDTLGRIARSVVGSSGGLPVTAKIRSGWSESQVNFLEVAGVLADAGISALTIHPRTREQGFSGKSDWSRIAELRAASPVPVIGSGDIYEPADVIAMFETTGCDAVMVGRGAMGNPWLFTRARALLQGAPDPGQPDVAGRFALALEQAQMMTERMGEERAVILMRKHLGWYTKGLPGASVLRGELFSCSRLQEIKELFQKYLQKGYQCTRSG